MRLAGRLSGGMKQKLGLACALVRTPRLLLLDEPGVGVDPISRRELWAMVHELTGQGIGVLWSTAYLDEAELCDDVCLLSEGRLIFSGLPARLTGGVEGRVIRVSGFAERRRDALTAALDRPDVIDGTIQGRAIRLLIRDGAPVPVPPRWPWGRRRKSRLPRRASRTASSSGWAADPRAPASWLLPTARSRRATGRRSKRRGSPSASAISRRRPT